MHQRHFTFPSTWMAVEPYAAQDSEASISLSSDTDESVDTQSDKEAVVLRKLSEGWIAQVPRALTHEGAGAEGPDTPCCGTPQGPSPTASGERRCRRP